MIRLADLLREATTKLNYKEHLSPRDIHELTSLIHTKKDLLLDPKTNLESLNKALQYYSETLPNTYRGLYPEEVKVIGKPQVGKTFSLDRYTSFSENVKASEEFADKTGQKTLIYLDAGAVGFCYHKFYMWYLDRLERMNPEEYDMMDSPNMIKVIQKEKEWILAKKTKYTIKSFKESNGYKIIECKA